jgi:hypothetical protein
MRIRSNDLYGTVAALAILAACEPALAGPTMLVCHLDAPTALAFEDGATTIELNEAQSSVVVHFAAAHLTNSDGVTGAADGRGSPNPAASVGPLTAKFGSDTITFSSTGGGEYDSNGNHFVPYQGSYLINRLTGSFVHKSPGDGALTVWQKWTCKPGNRQF